MPMYQRKRPSPIKVYRRQEAPPAPAETEAPSPESPDSPFSSPSTVGGLSSPDSPDEPESIEGAVGAEEGAESEDEEEEEEPEESEAPAVSGQQPTASQTGASVAPTGVAAAPQISGAPSTTGIPNATSAPTLSTSVVPDSVINFSSQNPSQARPTGIGNLPSAQSETAGTGGSSIGQDQPSRSAQSANNGGGGMSRAAEAALITFTVIGGIALIIGALFFLKKRRRAKQQSLEGHADDPFDPGNSGSLREPEIVHTGHMTRSTDHTTSLFGGGTYQRPETVSTENNRSRIAPPEPTPNPFADPPLNKAYDVLRGRPRSTTLTDRGSWTKNPFQDPVSERFDPFGELQERARAERVRYMEELQREQQMLEKERVGLGLR